MTDDKFLRVLIWLVVIDAVVFMRLFLSGNFDVSVMEGLR